MPAGLGALPLLLLLLLAAPAAPQARALDRFPAPAPAPLAPGAAGTEWMTTPAGAFASSLLLPGAGQAALGLKRWALYGVLELGLWGLRLDAAGDERRFRRRYRQLAWDAARLQDGGARQDGSWGYYEAMSRYPASGDYDRDAATPGLQPETDAATYNGVVWDLARGIFLPGGAGGPGTPGYEEALAYYQERAAGPGFLWDWAGREDDLERFRELIQRREDEARRGNMVVGLVLANHLVAAIDALIVARLHSQHDLHLRSGFHGAGSSLRWGVSLELTTPY